MDQVGSVNQEVLELWRDNFKEDNEVLVPLIYPNIKKSGLLFIGLNPSFNAKTFLQSLKDHPEYSKITVSELDEFFHWNNSAKWSDKSNLKKLKDIEETARNFGRKQTKPGYFEAFAKIAKYIGIHDDWEHIDLFFFRKTSQKDFKTINFNGYKLKNYNKKGDLAGFLWNQFALSKKLIMRLTPKIIVVANAFASKIFKEEFDGKFNDEVGCHEIDLNNQTIPVFLGSMLSPPRPIDIYSRQRLEWHIKQVINKLT
jgi:hypothetical protein